MIKQAMQTTAEPTQPATNGGNDAHRWFVRQKLVAWHIDVPKSTTQHFPGSQLMTAPWLLLLLASLTMFAGGCSTLASIGLPVGNSTNRMLKSAREISEAPGRALPVPSELAKLPIDRYVVEIGDTIFVEPVKFDATIRLPGDQMVKPDGFISIGEFGTFEAVNKTLDQIQIEIQSIIDAQLRQTLVAEFERQEARELELAAAENRPSYEPEVDINGDFLMPADEDLSAESRRKAAVKAADERRAAQAELAAERQREFDRKLFDEIAKNKISVRLVNWESKRIYVLGEVNSPGYFPFTGNQTVLDAVVEAGGLATKANHHQIIVSRPTPSGSCRIVMKVCYDHVVQLGDTSTNYQLQPGDRVFVPSLSFSDDLKQSLRFGRDVKCPRCACDAVGCVQ